MQNTGSKVTDAGLGITIFSR